MQYPKISILVTTYNEEKHIEECINSLLNQSYQGDFEIIVIDGNSTDRTIAIISNLALTTSKIKLLNNPNRIQSSGRNIGIRYSDAEYIVYLDAHSYAENDWLDHLWNTFHNLSQIDEKLAGVSSIYYDAQHSSFSRSLSNAYRSILIGSSSKSFLNIDKVTKVNNGYGILYKRKILIDAGLYDESLKTAEDIELNFRITNKCNYNLYVEPKAKAYYYFKENVVDVFTQQFRYGFWRIQAMKKLGKYSIKVLIPAILLFLLMIIFIGSITYFNEIRYTLMVLGLYLIMMVVGSVIESFKNKSNFIYFLINSIAIQFGYGCGVLVGIFYSLFK